MQRTVPSVIMNEMRQLHQNALQSGVLGKKEKELIAMATAIATGYESCIAYHLHNALEAGASHDEIVETTDVALMTLSEPTVVHGRQILRALEPDLQMDASAHPYMTPD